MRYKFADAHLHATSTLPFLHLWNQVCSRVMRLVHITALVRTASDWRVWGCAHRSAARTAVMEHRRPSLPWCCGSQAVASSSRPPFLGHGDATAWAGVTATTLYFWNRQQSAAPGSLCFAHYAQEAKMSSKWVMQTLFFIFCFSWNMPQLLHRSLWEEELKTGNAWHTDQTFTRYFLHTDDFL